MSDLISRSKLLKEIETWGGCVEALHEYIEKMPTAYDIDKVVEELEELKMRYFLTIANTGDAMDDFVYEQVGNALDKSIEIVKQGGTGKDVD